MNSLTKLLANAKTRTLLIATAGILVTGIVLVLVSGSEEKKEETLASKVTAVPANVSSTPGATISQKHRELIVAANKEGTQKAQKTGGTFLPTITGDNNGKFKDGDLSGSLANELENFTKGCSPDVVQAYRNKGMDNVAIIKELSKAGCTANDISKLFNADDIAKALIATNECPVGNCDSSLVDSMTKAGKNLDEITKALLNNGCKAEQIAVAMKESKVLDGKVTAAEIARAMKNNNIDAATVAASLLDAGFDRNEIVPALSAAGYSPSEIASANRVIEQRATSLKNLLNAERERALRESELEKREKAMREAQQLAVYGQQRRDLLNEMVKAMDGKASEVLASWDKVAPQAMVRGELATQDNTDDTNNDRKVIAPEIILKAGKIIFAVLDTAVNSDNPGPIMATIVSEPLKGSKLLGSMKSNYEAEQISLIFNVINIPNEPNSMAIDALAIDPDTARTALASDVDHHYLYRWGSLFASAFLQGYASSIATAGDTTVSTSNPSTGTAVTTTTTSADVSGRKELFKGLSTVGSRWGEVTAANFNRKPTITIEAGTSIGLLLVSDLEYNKEPSKGNLDPSREAIAAVTQGIVAAAPTIVNNSNNPNPVALGSTATTIPSTIQEKK